MLKSRITLDETKRDALALAIVALLARLFCIWRAAQVAGDGHMYLAFAKNLVFHNVFSTHDGTGALPPTAQRPPLYPALIAALWWGESAPITVVMILQAVLGAATVALVYLIARDKFSRTTAILAGIGMAFARLNCLYTAYIMTETLFTFLVTLGVFLWGRKRSVPAGIAFGMAALTRMTILPFLLVLPLIALLPKWRNQWRTLTAISIVALAVSSVWVARNAIVFGRFVPLQEYAFGQNLLFGTFETKTFWGRIWNGREWTTDQDTHPLHSMGEGLNGMDRERLRIRIALRRIAEDPLHWLAVRAQQYPRLFMDDSVIYPNEPPLLVLKGMLFHFFNFIIIALALFGAFIERKRFTALSHLMLFPAFILISHLPMWTEPRYSLPIIPIVAILAAVGSLPLLKTLRATVWHREQD